MIKKRSRVWVWSLSRLEWHRVKVIAVNRRYLTVKDKHGKIFDTYFRAEEGATKPTMNYDDYISDKIANSQWGYGMNATQKNSYRLLQRLGIKPR